RSRARCRRSTRSRCRRDPRARDPRAASIRRGSRGRAGGTSKPFKLRRVTTILLARHGETAWNRDLRWQGHADPPLTDRGRQQARGVSDRLADVRVAAVYSSDLRRALETAAIVAERSCLPVNAVPALREVDVGSWSGLTFDEVEARFPEGFRRWQALEGH